MSALMTDDLKRAAPSMANLDKLKTNWMNGIQFYLSRDEPLVNGHAIYLDSPWALTSDLAAPVLDQCGPVAVRQRHGPGNPLGRYFGLGDAGRRSMASLRGSARAEEIQEEVWTQLKQHLNDNGATPIVRRQPGGTGSSIRISSFPIPAMRPMPSRCSSTRQDH